MRRFNFNYLSLFILLSVAFLAGFYVRDFNAEQTDSIKTSPVSASNSPTTKQTQAAAKPDVANLDKIIRLAQKSQPVGLPNTTQILTDSLTQTTSPPVEAGSQSRPVGELLAAIDALAAQRKTSVEIRDSQVFQELLLAMTDSANRKLVLERFLKVSGTPLGETLSLALAMSRNGEDIPELKAAVTQLLSSGSVEQRLNALQLLGNGAQQDAGTRALVLDILRHDADANPQLALAALATVNRQGIISQNEHQNVVDTLAPLAHNQDPLVRHNSLNLLSQWAGQDELALKTFTEASVDSDPGVRSMAISALGSGNYAYEKVRDTLVSTLQNPNEDPGVKAAAQQALEKFPLDEQALQVYQAHVSNPLYRQQAGQIGFN